MSMLEQQAFQHLTSRWQRNCSFASSASMMGLTGLPANGEAAIMSLNSASFISLPYLPGPGPSLQKNNIQTGTRRLRAFGWMLNNLVALAGIAVGKKPGAVRRPEFTANLMNQWAAGLNSLDLSTRSTWARLKQFHCLEFLS